jgi:shikimate kinase
VVVLGLMASGKSTVGRALAERLGRRLVDNDEELGLLIGRSAVEHAELHGLDHLHGLEAEVLRRSLDNPEPAVITAAASVGDRSDLAELVAGQAVVWLDVDPAVLAARVPPEGDHRPLDDEALDQLRVQRARRGPAYRGAAELVLQWHHETPAELVDRIVAELGLER